MKVNTMETMLTQPKFQKIIEIAKEHFKQTDTAHDFSHCQRVLKNALEISKIEGGDIEVLTAAAFLHDICNFPKNDPRRKLSSEYSTKKAAEIMQSLDFDQEKIDKTKDAILCHSFSRGLTPKTLEGTIFQDADRLDGIGAIGIARAYATGAKFNALLYAQDDPFFKTNRLPNDKNNVLDHFFVKLFKLQEMMLTKTGKEIAQKRTTFMKTFVKQLEEEIV